MKKIWGFIFILVLGNSLIFTDLAWSLNGEYKLSSSRAPGPVVQNKPLKMELYACGLAVGQAFVKLAQTPAANSVQYLSQDLMNYVEQTNLAASTKNKIEKEQFLQAAFNSWQSILMNLKQIENSSLIDAVLINQVCDILPE